MHTEEGSLRYIFSTKILQQRWGVLQQLCLLITLNSLAREVPQSDARGLGGLSSIRLRMVK